jgi:fermentation-respiration switch protein FrsA (DUF1100 family)
MIAEFAQGSDRGVRVFRIRPFQPFLPAMLGALLILLAIDSALAQTGINEAQKVSEIRHNFPLDKFYDVVSPLPVGKTGDLIRSEEFDEYDLPPEVLAVRILYHSRSANGDDVAASGVVLYPDGKAPRSGWPVLAWAHPVNGVARQCAPSLTRNLLHGPYLSMYVNLGYAVVATDYAGLGTAFRNAFSDIQSNANDVIDAIPAARAAVPQLSSQWIAIGLAEGGPTAVAVAELESDMRDAGYLGSIAISGLDDPQGLYQRSGSSGYETPLFLAYGIKTVYRDFDVKDILTDKGLSLYPDVEKFCTDPSKRSPSGILKPNWAGNNFVKQYFSRNRPARQLAQRPILVISSELDPITPIARTTEIIATMCKQGDRIQFERYSESEMSSVFGDSVGDQISWIQARFGNRAPASNCNTNR